MKTSDRITLNQILLHKDHFDQRLVEISNTLDSQVIALTSSNSKLTSANQNYKIEIADIRDQIKDAESKKNTINKKYLKLKSEHEEILEYLKNLQKDIDKLKNENEKWQKEIEQQEKEIKDQATIIDKLRHMNSTNSNLPSSTDILGRTKSKAQANTRIKTDRKRGGQLNHSLHKSRITEKVDRIITIKVKKAPTGAVPVRNEEGIVEYYATQEVDLLLKSEITETRYYIDEKGEELDKSILNKYAINPLVYSGHFKATTVYLNQKGTVPLQRLCDMMSDISKGTIQLRAGTINKWCEEFHKKSEKENDTILKEILKEPVVHVDETGTKINGKQYWIHVITNDRGAFYSITKKRGDIEKGPIKLLERYSGSVVHDHFAPYQKLTLCQHVECNAHIDRYLKSGIEYDHNEECKELLNLLHEMLHRKNELIEEGIFTMPEFEINKFEGRYEEILKRGLKTYKDQHLKIKKKYEPDFVKTFRRMLVYKKDHLRFIKDFNIPYTNNAAERACRVVKAKKKISGQFVSEQGGEAYVSILSLLQTSKIKNENALETLERVYH